MRILLVALAVVVVTVAMAPALLLDRAVQELSDGTVRIERTEGTVWHGRGVVSVADGSTGTWPNWHQIDWAFDPAAMFHGGLAWQVTIRGSGPARVELGPGRWRVTNLSVTGPARYFLQRVSSPLAKLGWLGDVSVAVTALECSWRGVCDGHLGARWLNASCDCLPGQVFGDYAIEATGVAGDFKLSWSTLGGAIRIDGNGNLSTRGVSLAATVTGDATVLSHLPAVAGPWVTATADPRTWMIRLP